LSFPDVREELFDPVILRQVKRMQTVIDLGRVCRERRTIGLKTPLKTLTIIHPDQEYLDDVKSLEQYISEELNVVNIEFSSDEDKYNVQYSVSANWAELGKKLKKEAVKVKKALPGLSTEQCKGYLSSGTITVDGIKLEKGDLVVKRAPKESEATKLQEFNTDDDVIIILDVAMHPELQQEGLAREIINRVQRLRKKANLVPTDDVGMEFKVLTDPENIGIENVFTSQSAMIEKALRRPVDKHVVTEVEGEIVEGKKEDVILQEEQEVQKATFLLRLVRLDK
jgi:isoleucyl-tRNA synthetase